MSKYDALTRYLEDRTEPDVVVTFDELDQILGGLPDSARQYSAWWANKVTSQSHARAWLNAGRVATPSFDAGHARFSLVSEEAEQLIEEENGPDRSELARSYIESTISLEQDLEAHLVANLESIESGLELIGRQVTIGVGRIDILARSRQGQKVIIEVKVGEAKDAAIGQVSRYIGWYQRADGAAPRAFLIAATFPDPVRYAAEAIEGLRLRTYKVSFDFEDAGLDTPELGEVT